MVWNPDEEDLNEELEPVYYDVPGHLTEDLWDWTNFRLHTKVGDGSSHPTLIVTNALRLDVSRVDKGGFYARLTTQLETLCRAKPDMQLKVIRILLRELPNDGHADDLERRLRRGKSGYAVRADKRGLEFRVPPAARQQVERAVEVLHESVGQRLTKAWNEAYGMEPHPDAAWEAAFKATEAVLRPIITPKDPDAGLNKLIQVYQDDPSKWESEFVESRATFNPGRHMPLDGRETVIQMARTISYGQKARHGQDDANSLRGARAAVHLAVTVAMMCETGAFRRLAD